MFELNLKTGVYISFIVAVLLSMSPILLLLAHHSVEDILDKLLLFGTAFGVTFFNILFQKRLQDGSFSVFLLIFYGIIFNLFLLTLNILVRIPFWNMLVAHKPPLFILIGVEGIRNFTIALTTFFIVNYFRKNKKQAEDKFRIHLLEKETLQLQLNGLNAQLQPHFFFNSLNVLSELIYIDLPKSEEYVQQLSKFFRYVLSIQNHPLILLSEELAFIDVYIYLLKTRFGDNIQLNYALEKIDNYSIPSLCTLIVLENIVKHNNIKLVKITFELCQQTNSLKIGNTVHKKSSLSTDNLGYGLENINKKCTLLLKKGIQISQNTNYFEVAIPLKKNNENGI